VSEDPCDYSACTLAELNDVAEHIDRLQFPERASRVDAEIRRREALPIHLQEPISFRGGARWGESAIFGRTASWPFAELRFSTAELMVKAVGLDVQKFVFAREEVTAIEERQPVIERGLQILHHRVDYPSVIMFFSMTELDLIKRKLSERGWPVKAINAPA
jgi:hypothetical protein